MKNKRQTLPADPQVNQILTQPCHNQQAEQADSDNQSALQRRIARQFSHAADVYAKHNVLQLRTASMLQSNADLSGIVLDIGAGPGTAFPAAQQVIAVDIAAGMLLKLSCNFPDYTALCADAMALPLADNSIQAVYSNLALQWCSDFPQALAEIYRVLQPGGHCYVSLITAGSLPQLEYLGLRCNAFATANDIDAQINSLPWQQSQIQQKTVTVHFAQLTALLQSLKGIGASTPGPREAAVGRVTDENTNSNNDGHTVVTTAAGLKGRGFLRQLQRRAETLRTDAGLPLDYQVLTFCCQK